MKIRKISIFLATFLGAILALTSCTKNDGPITNKVTINDIPAISQLKLMLLVHRQLTF